MSNDGSDQRTTNGGSIKDRRTPGWAYWVLAVMAGILIAAGVAAFAVGRSAEHAQNSAGTATAALNASRAATDRLHAAAFGSCQRLQRERERVNVNSAVIYLVLRVVHESAPPKGRPALDVLARSNTYGPPANCQVAVDRPASYRAPPPIPFSRLPLRFAKALVAAARQGEPQPHPPNLKPSTVR